jgi:hypothetical protein
MAVAAAARYLQVEGRGGEGRGSQCPLVDTGWAWWVMLDLWVRVRDDVLPD